MHCFVNNFFGNNYLAACCFKNKALEKMTVRKLQQDIPFTSLLKS